MKTGPHFARRFRWLKLLRASLVAGALYDFFFAVVMATAPELVARPLRLPLPGERFYLLFMAVLLAMLAALYLLAARDPRRYAGVVAVAIAGRLAGALAFAGAAAGRADLAGLYPVAAADAAFAAAHTAFWWPIRS
jgi:hypothetical protein